MDQKTEHVLAGLAQAAEENTKALQADKLALEVQKGIVAGMKAAKAQIAAELATFADGARAKLDAGDMEENESASLKGHIDGLKHAVETLAKLEEQNAREILVVKGRIEAAARFEETLEKRRQAEVAKAERREREALEDPDAIREDGSPRPLAEANAEQ
jgi:hypothetical protein